MKYLIILSLVFSTNAFARKVIFESEGVQELAEITETGSVSGRVIWDEAVDGPLPVLPGEAGALDFVIDDAELTNEKGEPVLNEKGEKILIKVKRLVLSEEKRIALEARKKDKGDKEKSRKNEVDALKSLKVKLDAGDTITATEQRKILKFLLDALGPR